MGVEITKHPFEIACLGFQMEYKTLVYMCNEFFGVPQIYHGIPGVFVTIISLCYDIFFDFQDSK